MKGPYNKIFFLIPIIIVTYIAFSPCIAVAENVTSDNSNISYENGTPVHISGDNISYGEHDGVLNAYGNVVIDEETVTLKAPKVYYDSHSGVVEAFSNAYKDVVLISKQETISTFNGDHLIYNLNTGAGTFKDVSGSSDEMYLKGSDFCIMRSDVAADKKLIANKDRTLTESIGTWKNVSMTTCDCASPHYRLQTNQAIIVPGIKTTLKHPDVYLGNKRIFRYPFDYIIRQGKSSNSIMPVIKYEDKKGTGIGIKGAYDLNDWGSIDFGFVGWTEDFLECNFTYEKNLTDRLGLYIESARLYNKFDGQIKWRPKWGATYYIGDGWRANLDFAERHLITTTMIAGERKEYNVWKRPEFTLSSPSYGNEHFKYSFTAQYGRYQDNVASVMPFRDRWAITANFEGSIDLHNKNIRPYYGGHHRFYDYEYGTERQNVSDIYVGVNWKIGLFRFNTEYMKRWVDGASMLVWDNYSDNENIYQSVKVPLPFGDRLVHWNLGVRATYDLMRTRLAQMDYVLQYNPHCTTWELSIQDERVSENKNFRLSFFINAYPNKAVSLGSDRASFSY